MLVVRHGETPWTREGRVQGWAAVPLTERGREQAQRTGRYIDDRYDPTRVVSSDVRRALETAGLLADELSGSVGVETDAGWRERHFGPRQGFSDERYHGDTDRTVEGTVEFGESWDEFHDRVDDAWDRLRATAADDVATVVVTHNGAVMRLTERLTGDRERLEEGQFLVVADGAVERVDPADGE